MSNTLKLSGGVRLGNLTSDPANPANGLMYFNTTTGKFRQYENGAFREVSAQDLSAHIVNDAALKHDADEVNYERIDGSRKNIQANATSPNIEAAVSDLDDAIGTLNQGTNYTASAADEVGSHLDAIDTALASAGGTTFADDTFRVQDNADATKQIAFEAANIGSGITRTVTMPNSNVALGDVATNKASIDGHIDGGVGKHDASEIDVEAADGKNHSAGSAEAVIGELDDAIGELSFVPSNYTNPAADVVADHLANIDTAIGTKANDADVTKKDGSVAFTGNQSMGSNKITSLADGVASTDAATKGQVDAASAGMLPKAPVDLATTANISLTGEQTIDGTLTSATRILVDAQTAPAENGIYVTAAGAWSRAADADGTPASEIQGGNSVFVNNGTVNANTVFRLTGTGNITVNVGAQDWVIYSRAEALAAGSGLTKSGLDFNVGAGDGISVAADTVAVDGTVTRADGSVSFSGAQSMGSNKLTNVSDGTVAGDAVNKSQLDTKIANVVEDTTPQLGGNLDYNGNAALGIEKRGSVAAPTNLVEEEYIDDITLAASQTDTVIAALTFAHASFEGLEMTYKIKESTSGDVRIGTIRVATNGTAVVINDVSTETADAGVEFSAVVNGASINIRYTSGSNGGTMRADVKRIRA